MKLVLWILLGLFVSGLAFWMVTTPGIPRSPLLILLVIVVFAVPPFGAIWMVYIAIRYEKHPLPMILLAMLPYTFLWYYFGRVRPGTHLLNGHAAGPQ